MENYMFKIPAEFEKGYVRKLDLLNKRFADSGKIVETYGSLPASFTGNARPNLMLQDVSIEELNRYIKESASCGIDFNYTMNSPWQGNIEHTAEGKKKIVGEIKALSDAGVEHITIGSPYLIQLVHEICPHMIISASINMCTSTLYEIDHLKRLGAAKVVLNRHINKSFTLLKGIIEKSPIPVELLLNSLCQLHCNMHNYHNLINSHASTYTGDIDHFPVYPEMQCILDYLEHPEKIICAGWIRPEDLHYYSEIGYHHFKFEGRLGSTEDVLRIADIYMSEKYEGNFLDLFYHYFNSDRFKDALEISLDNRDLDNFIEPFVKGKMDCALCMGNNPYCMGFAEKIRQNNAHLNVVKENYTKGISSYFTGVASEKVHRD